MPKPARMSTNCEVVIQVAKKPRPSGPRLRLSRIDDNKPRPSAPRFVTNVELTSLTKGAAINLQVASFMSAPRRRLFSRAGQNHRAPRIWWDRADKGVPTPVSAYAHKSTSHLGGDPE